MQEIVLLGHLTCYHFGAFLAIANGGKTFRLYTVSYQVVDNALGSALTEFLVVLVLASVVAVRRELDGYIGVLVQEVYQAVQCLSTAFCKGSAVELVEYVTDKYRIINAGQREL